MLRPNRSVNSAWLFLTNPTSFLDFFLLLVYNVFQTQHSPHTLPSLPKNWCLQIVMLEKTLESPLDFKIKPVNPKGNQSWIFIGRTDAEAEAPILWPPDVKNWFIGKDPDAGNDWGQEKGPTEDEMVGWHHWHNAPEFEQTPGDSEGHGSLMCCSPWVCKESDMT